MLLKGNKIIKKPPQNGYMRKDEFPDRRGKRRTNDPAKMYKVAVA
jgi:hypothetical protein